MNLKVGCHDLPTSHIFLNLAAPPNLNFATHGNFMQNRDLIYSAVCRQKIMPHAEIPFRYFWTEDTGVVYLPGLLATGLGYPSCP